MEFYRKHILKNRTEKIGWFYFRSKIFKCSSKCSFQAPSKYTKCTVLFLRLPQMFHIQGCSVSDRPFDFTKWTPPSRFPRMGSERWLFLSFRKTFCEISLPFPFNKVAILRSIGCSFTFDSKGNLYCVKSNIYH